MSCDTITALKKYLKIFKEKGLYGMCGKNVTVVEKEINVVCSLLNEMGALPEETADNVLNKLTHCSVTKLTKLFDFMLQAARVDVLNLDADSDYNTVTVNTKYSPKTFRFIPFRNYSTNFSCCSVHCQTL